MQLSEIGLLFMIHVISAFMLFGLGIVYEWLNVALSFITQPLLSSLLLCWIRVVLAAVSSMMFVVHFVLSQPAYFEPVMKISVVFFVVVFGVVGAQAFQRGISS